MNSVKPQQELDLLANVIERHPEGGSAEEVLQESGLALQRRSLQRRLASLVEQGRIRVQGQARAVRYFPGLQDQRPSGLGSSSAEAETEPYALQGQILGMCAAVATGAGIALQLPADGCWGAVQLPRDGAYAVVLLPQAGNRDAVFRLELVIVRGGAWHLRTLQVDRCCTSLLNPPNKKAPQTFDLRGSSIPHATA